MFKRILLLFICLSCINAALAQDWIIDTDVGLDDLLAISYVLHQPDMPVKAITIESNGNAHCQPAYISIKGLLALEHQNQILVACGRPTPLQGQHQFPAEIVKAGDQLAQLFPDQAELKVPQESAKALLAQTLAKSHEKLSILAIGPLTTLAEVLDAQPELKDKIQRIVIMGGAVRVPGNIKNAEWNIYIDPYAAQKVFASGIPIMLVPLDATQQALMDEKFYLDLQQRKSTPAADLAYKMLQDNLADIRKKEWYFWDPMAAVLAQDSALGRFETLRLNVRDSGATVIDIQNGHPVQVCTGIKVEKFKEQLLQGINKKMG